MRCFWLNKCSDAYNSDDFSEKKKQFWNLPVSAVVDADVVTAVDAVDVVIGVVGVVTTDVVVGVVFSVVVGGAVVDCVVDDGVVVNGSGLSRFSEK